MTHNKPFDSHQTERWLFHEWFFIFRLRVKNQNIRRKNRHRKRIRKRVRLETQFFCSWVPSLYEFSTSPPSHRMGRMGRMGLLLKFAWIWWTNQAKKMHSKQQLGNLGFRLSWKIPGDKLLHSRNCLGGGYGVTKNQKYFFWDPVECFVRFFSNDQKTTIS